jgi:hypothetical protein
VLILIAGALVTVSVTGKLFGLLLAPGAVIVIVPLYVPVARPAGFTETLRLVGAVPLAGVTDSQLPPLAIAVNDIGELAVTARAWGCGRVPEF